MRARDAVIDRPHRVPLVRRGLFATITLLAWSVFGWLLLPVLTLALWALGLAVAWEEAVARWHDIDPALLATLALASAAMAGVLVAWAEVQRRRFSGPERRRRLPDVEPVEVAGSFGASAEVAEALRSGRVLRLEIAADGRPTDVTVLAVAALDGHEVPTPRSGRRPGSAERRDLDAQRGELLGAAVVGGQHPDAVGADGHGVLPVGGA